MIDENSFDNESRRLDTVLFRCVDETLSGMMGLVVRDTIYLRILTKFLVTRDELPRHVDQLITVMEEGLGEKPTAVISKQIAKRLFSELRLKIPPGDSLDLKDYIKEALVQTAK
jgi:hypothetical protein